MVEPAPQRLKIAEGRRLQWEAAQDCHVLLYPEGMVQLSESAAIILQLCDGTRTRDQLLNELQQRFPGADLASDVDEFLAIARERQWIAGD
jgi:pyrroloquinoline quinone biosynthesis protein D